MGGHLTVSSVENRGSTFTFVLPYKVSSMSENSDDPDELSDTEHQDVQDGTDDDLRSGVFVFQPRSLGPLVACQSFSRTPMILPNSYGLNVSKVDGVVDDSPSPSSNITCKETSSEEDANSTAGHMETSLINDLDVPKARLNNVKSSPKNEQARFHPYDHKSPETRRVEAQTNACPKILLVEDNKINVMVTKSMMEKLGHRIDVVSNGAEAVRAVQCNAYDLILMV